MKNGLFTLVAAMLTAACSGKSFTAYELLLDGKYDMEHTCSEWIVVGGLDVLVCKGSDNIVRNVYMINGELTY